MHTNEGGDHFAQAEKYKEDNGCYPERNLRLIFIYINRENRPLLHEKRNRLSGKPGASPKEPRAELLPQAATQLLISADQ